MNVSTSFVFQTSTAIWRSALIPLGLAPNYGPCFKQHPLLMNLSTTLSILTAAGATSMQDRSIARRSLITALSLAPMTMWSPTWAQSSPYPNKTIRIVVPFSSGGTIDTVCRNVIEQLAKQLGQAIYLDAKPGANGLLGTSAVASAPPDGYTLLLVTASFAVNPSIYRKLPYDPLKAFTPITSLVRSSGLLLVANTSVQAKNLQELIAISKKVDLNYSSSGIGNQLHLSMELLKANSGLRATHVPYKGSSAALNAIISDEVQIGFVSPVLASPFLKSGRIKAFATTSPVRIADSPEIPTLEEAGSKALGVDGSWIGLFCPSGTPTPIVKQLHAAIVEVLKQPAVRGSISANGSGFTADGRTPAEFTKQIAADIKSFGEAVRIAGIEPE